MCVCVCEGGGGAAGFINFFVTYLVGGRGSIKN